MNIMSHLLEDSMCRKPYIHVSRETVFAVETHRPYEGSWVEKIYSTREKAQKHLEDYPLNDELVIVEYEVR